MSEAEGTVQVCVMFTDPVASSGQLLIESSLIDGSATCKPGLYDNVPVADPGGWSGPPHF